MWVYRHHFQNKFQSEQYFFSKIREKERRRLPCCPHPDPKPVRRQPDHRAKLSSPQPITSRRNRRRKRFPLTRRRRNQQRMKMMLLILTRYELTSTYLYYFFVSYVGTLPVANVADPGCLSRIRIFPSRVLGKKKSGSASKNLSILTPKNKVFLLITF
jgi:hypothetical protein